MFVGKSGYVNSLVEAGLVDGKDLIVGKSGYWKSLVEAGLVDI